ncbi:adenylate/guanylate cyclase domain-containing protein [Herbaspirillum sp. SJZ107]|uniref:adenylate/guanylate cyclase domain-containing protein n=1 Tax=Herbaspirillum sp. SJZ107 TaxID=2572881 RepID=UPI00114E7522|nr:adenylate/guanylate cyclase domain-containing protein [Herbaspirillum sp. SJZ107]TQK10169.1 adenylate/guanylate cyclase family protein [Herbaspirillum sp. SJZ107]
MALLEDLNARVGEIVRTAWGNIPNPRVIPTPADLTFGNTGERLNVTMFYADIRGSTSMVDTLSDTRAAEYYKAFLHCAAKIIKANDGAIQAYDGDRVMAAFVGERQADNAVRAAMQINFAVLKIINPQFDALYLGTPYTLRHTVGIDSGQVLVAKTGVRVDSDLVWVGSAANYAAKLNSFPGSDQAWPTRITEPVLLALSHSRLYDVDGDVMWAGPYNDIKRSHYRSAHWMPIY